MKSQEKNQLYFGDCLDILRESIKDESVDLVYLDPPFNSNATYNVLFKGPKGHAEHAQIEAFEDTWHWGDQAEREFQELVQQSNTDVAEMMQALRRFLGENDVMAYLTMIANRLIEMYRSLKPTGSLYLHCDPTASHYLKIVLDGVFGKERFVNEIVWKRTSAHSDVVQGATHFGRVHDTILTYARTEDAKWNTIYLPYNEEYVENIYRYTETNGRRYQTQPLHAAKPGGDTRYEWRGKVPPPGRYWAFSKENMEKLEAQGRIVYSKTGTPRYKIYLDESKGVTAQDIWSDISPVHNEPSERLGYPTQKPLALLERIIQASSNEGDLVLDPFCGCGTAVHAAEKLRRRWIGIDITHLAISLIEKRLRDAFSAIEFEVHGTPKDIEGAQDLAKRDKYQFQWWACSLVNAQPYRGKKKGADTGIDGLIFFQDDEKEIGKIVVSVKGGENVDVKMVRELAHVVDREKAQIGLLVTLASPTRPMVQEATKIGFYESPMIRRSFPKIQILTVAGLLSGAEQAIYPDLGRGGLTFKQAKKDSRSDQKGLF